MEIIGSIESGAAVAQKTLECGAIEVFSGFTCQVSGAIVQEKSTILRDSMIRVLSVVGVALSLLVPVMSGEAQSKPPRELQEGEIKLESTRKQSRSLEARGRQETSAWMRSLQSTVQEKGARHPTELGDPGISYVAAFYFYCSVKLGDCGFILDALLEDDVITSRAAGEASCPTMNRFWKRWLAGDFDERAKYRVSAASGSRLASFNTNERPRYVKCRDTVGDIIHAPFNPDARYATDGEVRVAVARTNSLLEEIWAKNLDIFDGVEPESAE